MTLTAVPALDEHRTARISPLLSPALLRHELPVDAAVADTVTRARAEVVDILDGRDDRLIVVVGPCSIHDPEAAMDYARRLAAHTERVAGELRVVMRTYFEKPRSTVGLEGPDQRPRPGRHVRRQHRAAHRAAAAPGRLGARPARRLRVPRPDHPAVPRRRRELGRDRRPHGREPGAPAAVQRAVDARRDQEPDRRRRAGRDRRRPRRRRPATCSWASTRTAWPP